MRVRTCFIQIKNVFQLMNRYNQIMKKKYIYINTNQLECTYRKGNTNK